MSMEIESLLLTSENSSRLKETTVGRFIEESGNSELWSERTSEVDTIVVHFMSDRFRSPKSPYEKDALVSIFIEYGVSAHYLILRDGRVLNLVPEDKKAWHAGGSIMPSPDNRTSVNDFSIGIELAGSELEEFSEKQYSSLNILISDIGKRHSVRALIGHEDIAGERAVEMSLRKDIKCDPGACFEWSKVNALKFL